jgi:parallel beta-helix repeat protein
VRLVGNAFENLGVAIHVSESADALVACNAIEGIAGNGIYLGTEWGSFGRSDGARILGNGIRKVGETYLDSAGVWFHAADGVTIADNRIEDVPQTGISGGSVWGDQDASHGATIARNVVIGANRRTADGGAIKLMGAQSDLMASVIRDNLVVGTDQLMNRPDGSFWPAHYENTEEWPGPISWAIYLDGRASGVTIEGNTLRDNVAGIGINGGWSNVVIGNVIVGGYGSAFRIDDATGRGWRPDWAGPNRIEGNLVTTERRPGRVVEVNAPDHGEDFVRFARNLYVGPLGEKSFRYSPGMGWLGDTGDFAAFRRTGQEDGSQAVDLSAPGG